MEVRHLTEKKEYTNYRQNSGIPFKERVVGRDKWNRFVLDYFELIQDRIIEEESGVYIDRLGYFFIWKTDIVSAYRIPFRKKGYNFQGSKNIHFPVFFPVKGLFYYSMDKNFSKPFKKRLKEKLREGKKYKQYSYTLKRIDKI